MLGWLDAWNRHKKKPHSIVYTETLTRDQSDYWKTKGVTYKPILEYRPLTKQEEQRLNTEYYDNNNRVGFEKLYAAVRKPAGKSRTGKPQFSPTIRQVQAWLAQQEVGRC